MEVFTFVTTLIGVIVGAAIAVVWDFIKQSRADRQTRASVRTLLSQEVAHNVEFLTTVRDSYKAEEKLHQETSRPDGMGGITHEGDPVGLLRNTQFDLISQDAWSSQMSVLHLALNADEIASMYGFYGHLRSTKAAYERFVDYRPSDPRMARRSYGIFADWVIKEVETALNAAPKLEVK